MKPVTEQLINNAMLDTVPESRACRVDFGIRTTSIFAAYQWGVRRGTFTGEELDAALGNGPKLTDLLARGGNPHACTITTVYDMLPPEEER